ncbi:hypothetical protein [Kingella bonacorsii]|jgi:hypothetical protein|uniref:Uncharacterized protein n=2 Tax=Kingella TaxID=32257 RepID=A0ABS1BW81_9NEIS|nr:hypothetical protein [Kingella bonacorsii]MBK0395585.1 hypothetical protein [Kingella bonacorsii]MBK0397531.1 hypothetical protein [Kingella bonacorsii]
MRGREYDYNLRVGNRASIARWLCRQAEQQTGVFVGRNLEAREAKIATQLMKELI